jgi:hypothetical protein
MGGSGGDWRVGDVVDGRYEVLRSHEHGGMGLAHQVRHLASGTDLAVKSPGPKAGRAGRRVPLANARTDRSLPSIAPAPVNSEAGVPHASVVPHRP